MEQIRKIIVDILSCDDNITDAVISKLTELGVTKVSDLIEVQVSDLTPNPLLPVPARKLVRQWSNPGFDASHVTASSTTTTPPCLRDQPSTSSTALTTTVTTPLSSDKYLSNWANNFDVQKCVSEMMKYNEISVQRAAQNLSGGKILSHASRNEIIRCMTDSIRKVCSTPSRKSLSIIAEALVTSYPQLRDEVGEIVIGPGFLSVRNQLKNRVAYLRRPINNDRRLASARRRIDNDAEIEVDILPKKQIRDGYGCIDFLPVSLPDGETEDSLKSKHEKLKAMHDGNKWNETEVTEHMNITYILQRRDLVGTNPLSVHEIKREWPFLCQPKWIFEHLLRLVGVSILEKLETSILSKTEMILKFFNNVAPSMKAVGNKLSEFSASTQPVIGVITVLIAYFSESESVLFRGFEVIVYYICQLFDSVASGNSTVANMFSVFYACYSFLPIFCP